MNILITNAVPLNGGDEALLRALIESLRECWPDCSITTLCNALERTRQQLPDLRLASDLEFAEAETLRQASELYRQADLILSAPGGFLNDFYPLEDRLRGFEVALALRKPLLVLGQSLGPFWKPESLRRIPHVLNRVSAICIRDQASREHLLQAGVNPARIRPAADVAFLWRRLAPDLFRPRTGPVCRVGLCFRVWPLGDTVAVKQTLAKADLLCRFLLAEPRRELVFISTCQGIPNYVDDSELAAQVVAALPHELQERCQINRSRLGPCELIRALGECDAFIGMRLHACLLSMLGGTPAMGLGYEQKTADIFQQYGLDLYQIPFDRDEDAWLNCARRFLSDVAGIHARLPELLDQASLRAQLNLDAVAQCLAAQQGPGSASQPQPQSEWKDLVTTYNLPHLRLRQVAALVKEIAPRQILDLGCATGQLRQLCPGIDYLGCDFVAPKTPVDFPFYQCDFNHQRLPADLRELEAIVCSGLLEYLDDLPAFLAQLRSRLRLGGHFIATYFNMNHISRIWMLLHGLSFPVRPDWRGFHSPHDFKRLLRQAGFEIIRSVAMNHSLKSAAPVERTVSCPLRLPPERPWSRLFAHQILVVARSSSSPVRPLEDLKKLIPPGASFILVDEAQWANEDFAGRRPIPFLEKDGQYWGPPADADTAIRECERLRQAGARFIVFIGPCFWWLDHYPAFQRYLRERFPCALENECLLIFSLMRRSE